MAAVAVNVMTWPILGVAGFTEIAVITQSLRPSTNAAAVSVRLPAKVASGERILTVLVKGATADADANGRAIGTVNVMMAPAWTSVKVQSSALLPAGITGHEPVAVPVPVTVLVGVKDGVI